MRYRFIEEEATADLAFEATGRGLPDVFTNASDALMNAMIGNPDDIQPQESRSIQLEDEELDLLLVGLLQQLIYHKDAEQLLLRVKEVNLEQLGRSWHLNAVGQGERIDPKRHHQLVDVKAVTLHDFRLEHVDDGWRAHVILDV